MGKVRTIWSKLLPRRANHLITRGKSVLGHCFPILGVFWVLLVVVVTSSYSRVLSIIDMLGWIILDNSLLCVRECLVHCWTFHSILGLCINSTPKVWQPGMSPEMAKCLWGSSWLRITALEEKECPGREYPPLRTRASFRYFGILKAPLKCQW